MIKYLNLLAFSIILLSSCVEPNFEVEDYQSQIVIDGWIEQGKYPQVLLTLSAPYFSEIDSVSLRNYSLTRAKVSVSNGEITEVLTLKPNDAYFPPYMYVGTSLKGEVGKSYTLTVEYAGVKAIATTTIPEPVSIDSLWFALDQGKDSLGYIWVQFTDKPSRKNYYRTLTQIKNTDSKYIPNYFPNWNDDYFDGQKVEISLFKGNKTSTNKTDQVYYQVGDTISLKFTAIDKASYDFWNTFQKEILNTGNPFASTNARVQTNVTNGLGIWCGYGSSYYQGIAR